MNRSEKAALIAQIKAKADAASFVVVTDFKGMTVEELTRLRVMLHRYAGSPAATERELHFSDAEAVSAYAREAVRWAVENGILSGYQDGSVTPRGKITRAQTAAMLTRYVEFLNQQ